MKGTKKEESNMKEGRMKERTAGKGRKKKKRQKKRMMEEENERKKE